MLQNIFLFVFALIAYIVKGITGFGNTLVMGSLFSFLIPNRLTTPVDLLISIPTNVYMVWKERRSISIKVVLPLSLMLLAGIIPGTLLLKVGSDWMLKSILGLVVIGLAVEMLLRKPVQNITSQKNSLVLVVIGLISGVLAGLYGIGALLVAYVSRTTETRSQFRANICCVFLVDNLFRLFIYLYMGIFNREVLLLTLMIIPAVILGMTIGIRIDAKMKEMAVKKTVIAILIVSGMILFVKNIFFH